ncbi:MAG: bifunctional folylpolyglutamate synthase/dihydrofolate synthase [Clostridia bacterium]|nr:bifunctional folylpolyglutamate synthase/dihydrofolate synthase [Clostridia bacterium]
MNYTESLEYIHSITWRGSRPGLSRTAELLKKLGDPQKGQKFIHVAGTNGKGSVCAMLDSVLRAAGYKVGLYTSPYIVRFNERMQVNGTPVSDEELAELTTYIRPFADSMADPPTEFELITALAFVFFKRHGCDVVVLEVGMGGRLDSTNVIESPLVSVITGIALDHTAVLGNTVEAIAGEKAGIIKPGRPVVYGGRDDAAFKVIAEKAKESGSALTRTAAGSIKIRSCGINGTVFDYGRLKGVSVGLCGSYQPENAATVIETLRALRRLGLKIAPAALRKGIAGAVWPARFELLSKDIPAVFDGSHNVQGVTAAVDSIKQTLGKKVVLLAGILADKDYAGMVKLLSQVASEAFTVTPPSPRALGAKELAAVFESNGVKAASCEDIPSGVRAAALRARALGAPLVMLGSLYMYGEVKAAFDTFSTHTISGV